MTEHLPDIANLHPLDRWRRRENLNWSQVSARIGAKGPRTARRYSLAPSDPEHRTPSPPIMVRIFVESRGEVQPNHFYALPLLDHGTGIAA